MQIVDMFVVQEFFEHIVFFPSGIGMDMVRAVSLLLVVVVLSSSLYADCCFV